MIPRREQQGRNGPSPDMAPCTGEFATLYPCLAEFLSALEWEEGVKRVTGTVLICSEEGRWRGWLHDRDTCCSLWVSADDLDTLFMALDQSIANCSGDWRRDKPRGGPNRGRGS